MRSSTPKTHIRNPTTPHASSTSKIHFRNPHPKGPHHTPPDTTDAVVDAPHRNCKTKQPRAASNTAKPMLVDGEPVRIITDEDNDVQPLNA